MWTPQVVWPELLSPRDNGGTGVGQTEPNMIRFRKQALELLVFDRRHGEDDQLGEMAVVAQIDLARAHEGYRSR